jgi:hypothetical protein
VTVAAGVAIVFVATIIAIVFNGADVVGVGVGINVVVFNVADAMLQYSQQIKITWNC